MHVCDLLRVVHICIRVQAKSGTEKNSVALSPLVGALSTCLFCVMVNPHELT